MPLRRPERRSHERFATVLEGVIPGAADRASIACSVRDLSESGVRLVISGPADIPLEFELRIPDAGAIAMVRLVWASGSHFGARFMN
jgi:hypothetical protein